MARNETHRRRDRYHKERNKIWDHDCDLHEQIERLEELFEQYPMYQKTLGDIASCYIELGDRENATRTYQRILEGVETFEDNWPETIAKAHLFTGDADHAIERLEAAIRTSFDHKSGCTLALAYLQKGDEAAFERAFDEWIKADLRRSFDSYYAMKAVRLLFDKHTADYVERTWDAYGSHYVNMDPYDLYRELYRQNYRLLHPKHANAMDADPDAALPGMLGEYKFEKLAREYLDLHHELLFGDLSEREFERWSELQNNIYASTIFD